MKLKSAILSTVFLWSIFCESGVAQVYRIGGGGFGYGGGYGGGYGYSSGVPSYGIYGYGTGYQTVGGVRIVPVYYRVPVIIIRKKACDWETAPTSELRIPTREEEKQAEKNESILPPEPPKPGKTFQRETPEPPAKRKPEAQPQEHKRPQQPVQVDERMLRARMSFVVSPSRGSASEMFGEMIARNHPSKTQIARTRVVEAENAPACVPVTARPGSDAVRNPVTTGNSRPATMYSVNTEVDPAYYHGD